MPHEPTTKYFIGAASSGVTSNDVCWWRWSSGRTATARELAGAAF